jgi:signal peptide peptidase SppA
MRRHRAAFDKRGLLAMRADVWGAMFEVEAEKPDFELRDDIAIVRVEGPLTQRADWFWDSYDAIKDRVCAALDSSAKTVVLRIDSPGGDVAGCFETAREIRGLAELAGKPLVAYADGLAASAGYALACAASKIYLPATGFVGSIGVISTLFDAVGLNAKMGLNFEVIASGKRKRYGHPNVPISDAAIANTQQQVDDLAELFFALVSESRGIDVASVAALEAGVLLGQQAVSARLADGVCTFDELLDSLSSGDTEASSGADNEDNMGWKDALKKAADEGDEEAKKALSALDEKDEDKAEDSDEKKESKAEDSGDDKQEDSDGDEKKATVVPAAFDAKAVERIVDAKLQVIADNAERDQLISSRKDITEKLSASLKTKPLAVVREVLDGIPVAPKRNPAADVTVQGTRGESQGKPASSLPTDMAAKLDERMGLSRRRATVRCDGTDLVFEAMTPEDARAFVAAKNGGK